MIFYYFLSVLLQSTFAFNLNDGFPTKCKNFSDKRTTSIDVKNSGRTFLTIPAHLTSNGQKEIRFFLANNHGISKAVIHEEQCKSPELVEIPLMVDEGYQGFSSNKYSFQDQWKFANETYFTVDGYLHRESNFWNPDDYCIESISDTHLLLKTCKLNCAADLSKTYLFTSNNENYENSRICIPKCCGIDETLILRDQTCRKLNDTEPNYFMPYLHLKDDIWFLTESKTGNVDTHKVLVRPILGRRRTWNSTHGISGGGKIWDLLNFQRSTMNCSKYTTESVFYRDVSNHGKHAKKRYNFRVEVRPGGVKITLLTRSRKWMEYKRDYCIDGLDGWGINQENEAVNQVVLLCQNVEDISGNIIFVDEHKSENISPVEYLYMLVTLSMAILLMFGSTMFWLIRNKLNFKGNLIRGHLYAVTGMYLYTFVALLVALTDHNNVDNNAVTVVNNDFREGKRIGWFCVLIGILCHYVYLSIFFWVGGMMCYDLFGYSETIRKGLSITIGLGAPLVLMIGFGTADLVYSDPWLDLVVPDYGVESCFISTWSAGYYLHIPVAIILGLIFIYAFVWFLRNYKSNFGVNTSHSKLDPTGISLVVVVLTALTFRWIIDATKWLREYSGQKEDHWFQITLLFAGRVIPAVVIFHVYCVNEVVLGLVGDKTSSVQNLVKVLKSRKLIWNGRGLIGQICDDVSNEDTIIIEGETILKEMRTE